MEYYISTHFYMITKYNRTLFADILGYSLFFISLDEIEFQD